MIHKTHGVFLAAVVLFIVAGVFLEIPPLSQSKEFGALNVMVVIFLLQSFVWTHYGTDYLVKDYRRRRLEEDAEAVTLISSVAFIGKLVLYVLIFFDGHAKPDDSDRKSASGFGGGGHRGGSGRFRMC